MRPAHPPVRRSAFAESCGTTLGELQQIDEGKGRFLYFIGTRSGAAAVELLPGLVQGALDALPIPRRMHWGAGSALFVRPVHWLVMLYGSEVVPATLLETDSGRETRGHRFHAPKPLRLASPGAYERTLAERGHVIADFGVRRERIRAQVTALAGELGGRALLGAALLDEVTALTEWPVALAGRFEERFLALPREVLISTLEDHQRYFPVEDATQRLLPCFIAVANLDSRDPDKVRAGNERVVRPRLADAAFFWEQDRRSPLAARCAGLDAVTFQARLGSLGDKVRRVGALALEIAPAIGAVPEEAARAAELCKCDLITAMVGEFPELQGIMGMYYARADGEAGEVAAAIREHYLPRSAGDELPVTRTGLALALADRLDTLAGIFAIGEKPTGAKDPFALRRAGLGVQRILIEKGLDLDLTQCLASAVARVSSDIARPSPPGAAAAKPAPDAAQVPAEIYDFLMERLRAYYLERPCAAVMPGMAAVTNEMFDAVLAARPASPLDFDARLKALEHLPRAPRVGEPDRRQQAHRQHPAQGAGCAAGAGRRAAPARERRGAPVRFHALDARCGRRGHRAARVHRRSRSPGAAASGGRCVLRSGDGDGRGPAAARQPAGAPGAAAGSVRGGRGSVAAARLSAAARTRAHRRRPAALQFAGSLFFTGFLFAFTFLYAIPFVIMCSLLPFRRRFPWRASGREASCGC